MLVTAATLAAGCGAAGHHSMAPASDPAGSPQVVGVRHLKPGHHTFHVGRDIRVGQRILCVTQSGRLAGGGSIQPRGHGVGQSTGVVATTSRNGRVQVACPANPGNA
ncbi:MAG TPA: hypothetical protein VN615_07160 [Gaiellales bacterium]|nr:hypothetical protein [Gaiellales bacterium]